MNLYTDASALVKRYEPEDGSDLVDDAMDEAGVLISSRVALVETLVTLGGKANAAGVRRARREWEWFEVMEVNEQLCERAIELGIKHGLKSLDALHLASALIASHDLTFATWDRRLHAAAQAEGMTTLPASLS